MRLTFIGHAGFLIEHGNTLLVMDPWLSEYGAYDSAWMQFPCNHHLADQVLAQLNKFEHVYVYISHEHKDHFDPDFLLEMLCVRPDLIFLIPNFKSKVFLNELRALGALNIRELENDEHCQVQKMDIYLFIDESGINHDSGILVKAGGHSFLNLNDCKVFDRCEYIKNKFGKIDVFSVQFSGASWHPICYDMPEDERALISKKKKLGKYRTLLNALKILKPHRYLPAAGPPALLDPLHYEINFQKDSIFPQQFDCAQYLSTFGLECHIDTIMPGDVYSFEEDRYLSLVDERISEDNFKLYLDRYKEKSQYLFEANLKNKPDDVECLFQDYFRWLQAKVKQFSIKESIPHHLFFAINELKDQYIFVNLNDQSCKIIHELAPDNYYLISYPAWQLARLISGAIKGEDLALTFRATMKRSPDMYSTWISCFMNSEPENLADNIKLIEAVSENDETIMVEANGVRYQIRRYCPHQGADLQYGWSEGNQWVCPKHRWHYDLEEGGVCKSSNACIDALKISLVD